MFLLHLTLYYGDLEIEAENSRMHLNPNLGALFRGSSGFRIMLETLNLVSK